MSYMSRLLGEIERKCPILIKLADAALNEARVHGARSVTLPPPRPLAEKTLAAMEKERKDHGSIVSLRLGGDGWSAHIYDPVLEGISSAGGFQDPESAWSAVITRRGEKARHAEEAQATGVVR